jgi:hypothetical protein
MGSHLTKTAGKIFWSGRRGSNPQPTAWEAATLPLSYSRPFLDFLLRRTSHGRVCAVPASLLS